MNVFQGTKMDKLFEICVKRYSFKCTKSDQTIFDDKNSRLLKDQYMSAVQKVTYILV